jgi:hypothetical protein
MNKKWIVVQELRKKTVPELITYAKAVVEKMTGNAYFEPPNPAPSPALADILADADNLGTEYRKHGPTKLKTSLVRHAKENLEMNLFLLGTSYVQSIANKNPDNAIAIIHSAGMKYRTRGTRLEGHFKVKNGTEEGTAKARTKRGTPYTIYEWLYKRSNEQQYKSAGKNMKASFTYTGLASATRYKFRVETTDNKRNTNLSDELELVIL